MTAVRKVVDSNTLTELFDLPSDFKGKKIEVILFPAEELKEENKSMMDASKTVKHSAYGRLKAYANPSLISEEGGAWEKEAAEKYDLR